MKLDSTPSFRARRHALVAALALALAAGCEDASTGLTVQLNLDRPVDVAFACYGGLRLTNGRTTAALTDEVITSAQPLAACDFRSQPLPEGTDLPSAPGQGDLTAEGGKELQTLTYFGLIVQSGPGTVALAQFKSTRATAFTGNDVEILDADSLTPGKNSISVGVTPVAIATDRSGCFAVTANAGSRDLSTLELNSAFRRDGQAVVERVTVTNAGTPVRAAPAALAIAPGPQVIGGAIVDDADVKIGTACPAKPLGIAYVAYPSCRAVAAIDLRDGKILKGVQFDAAGVATLVDPGAAWASECGGSAAITGGPAPSALDLVTDLRTHAATAPRRLAIGARSSNRVTVVDLDATARPTTLSQVSLFDPTGTLGVLDIAMSGHVGMGGADPKDADATGPYFQFVYAVATDGTVRVANVLGADRRECDTQLDPRFQRAKTAAELACQQLSGVGNPRRVGALGPGIAVPAEGVANAVSILRVNELPNDMRTASTTKLVGTFAFISSTTGATFVADIDDDLKGDKEDPGTPLAIDLATTAPHQLRDQVNDRSATVATTDAERLCNGIGPGIDDSGGVRGGARIAGPVALLSSTETVVSAKRGVLPFLQHFGCTGSDAPTGVAIPELSFAAAAAERELRFPDTRSMLSIEDWRLVWEGPLTADTLATDNNGPAVRQGSITVAGQTMKLGDRSRPFCAAGAEPFDVVQLRGCDPAATTPQCPLGTRCYVHPDSTLETGSCLPEKTADQLAETCRRFLVSSRRYGISGTPDRAELTLVPRPRVLATTPITGCADTQQCTDLAGYQATLLEEAHPSQSTATARRQYVCEADASRKPVTTGKRCVMTCARDADCDAGTVCVDGGGGGRCMESVVPPAQCVPGVQRYELRAADAMVVLSSQSGYRHPIVADSMGKCVRDPNASPLEIGRFPLAAPPCTGDGITDLLPNPCSTTVQHTEAIPQYLPGTCDAASPATALRTAATPAIRVRTPGFTFHFVNPTYPGDFRCRGDGLGFRVARQAGPLAIAGVSFAHTGYGMSFRLGGGHVPLPLRTGAIMPVRVVRGPQQSIWVVDEGDFLSDSAVLPSTRGKVYRIETHSLSTVNVLQ